MILYHRTPNGDSIIAHGFNNHGGRFGTDQWFEGVWLSDRPLGIQEGARGNDLLAVDIPDNEIAEYEWIEEGKPCREWLVPADVVNRYVIHTSFECSRCDNTVSLNDDDFIYWEAVAESPGSISVAMVCPECLTDAEQKMIDDQVEQAMADHSAKGMDEKASRERSQHQN